MISEPYSGILGPLVVESTSNKTVFAPSFDAVAFKRTGRKSIQSRNLYCPFFVELYVGICSYVGYESTVKNPGPAEVNPL